MKQIQTFFFGIAVIAGTFVPLSDANAWVAAGRGYRGGAVAVGGYGYHPAYRPAG